MKLCRENREALLPPLPADLKLTRCFRCVEGEAGLGFPRVDRASWGLTRPPSPDRAPGFFFFYQGFQLWTPKEEEVERLKSFQKSKSVVIIPLSNPYCDPLKLESSSQRRTLRFTEVRYLPRSSR